MGLLISSAYKAVTGRVHPAHTIGEDISADFRFGWMRGGVFWGWPSSHTTIAFAMAVTVFTLFPKHRWLGVMALAGAGIRQDERIYGVNLLDVAPTVLALFGLPAGEDMLDRGLIDVVGHAGGG